MNNKQYLMALAKHDGYKALNMASTKLRNDKDLVRIVVAQTGGDELYDIGKKLKDDVKFMTELDIKYPNGQILFYASDRIKDDYDTILVAVKRNGLILQDSVSDRLLNDKTIVLAAIKQIGAALIYSPLQTDVELKKIAMMDTSYNILYLNCCDVIDRELLLHVLKYNHVNLMDVDALDADLDDIEVATALINAGYRCIIIDMIYNDNSSLTIEHCREHFDVEFKDLMEKYDIKFDEKMINPNYLNILK